MLSALAPYWSQFLLQFDHAKFCSSTNLNNPECHGFWMSSLFIVEAVGFLVLVPFVYREYQIYRGRKSYLKWLAEYEKIADPEVMAKASWPGHSYVPEDLSQEALADKIRQGIANRSRTPDTQQ